MNTFKRYLEFSLCHIPNEILCQKNKLILLRLGDVLPDIFAHFVFGYEKRLTDRNSKLDIAVSTLNDISAPHNFQSIFNHEPISALLRFSKEWHRLQTFAELWSDTESATHRLLEGLSLEFDFDSLEENNFIPSVFLGIESLPHTLRFQPGSERLDVLLEGITCLSGNDVSRQTELFLSELTQQLANRESIFQIGLMLSRKDTPVRVCIKRLDTHRLLHILNSMIPESNLFQGTKDSLIQETKNTLQKYGKYFDHFVLAFDVLESNLVKVGVECYYTAKSQPMREKRWNGVLEALCADGYCSEEIMNSILTYPRKVNTSELDIFRDFYAHPIFYAQGLHHIKFTIGANPDCFAKVYMWAGYNFQG